MSEKMKKMAMVAAMAVAMAGWTETGIVAIGPDGADAPVGQALMIDAVSGSESGTITVKSVRSGMPVYKTVTAGYVVDVSNWVERTVGKIETNRVSTMELVQTQVTNWYYVAGVLTNSVVAVSNYEERTASVLTTNWVEKTRSMEITNEVGKVVLDYVPLYTNTLGEITLSENQGSTELTNKFMAGERLYLNGKTNSSVRLFYRR